MKIIGYNSSHETAIAQFDTDTHTIDFVYEEERFRRVKQWHPKPGQTDLLCIIRKNIQTPDAMIACSFDRREWSWHWKTDEIKYDKMLQREILQDITQSVHTVERTKEIQKKWSEYVVPVVQDTNDYKFVDSPMDDLYHGAVAEQLGLENYTYEIEHHMYHAECGYYMSPWREKENAIVLVQDGGGCKRYHDTYPNYQEMETIYLCQPEKAPTRQWGRMSDNRFMDNMGQDNFWEFQKNAVIETPIFETEIDGVPTVFSSQPSMGQNFSSLSLYFGFDKLGRAAGKVMGAASYHEFDQTADLGDFTMHSLGNFLQQKSYEYTVKLIQKAIDLNPDVPNIILSGGYALNCTNNAKYLEAFPNHQFFVDPIAHDGGTAVGGAIRMGRAQLGGEDI